MKSGTMGDKTLGGGNFFLSVSRIEDEKRKTIGAKNRKIKKTESRMLIHKTQV